MKILLATSDITFVPGNYSLMIDKITKAFPHDISGLLIVNYLPFKLKSALTVAKFIGLYFIGCKNIANTLFCNIYDKFFTKKRQKICENFNIPVIYANSVNDQSVIEWIRKNDIDLIVNLRTRDIYRSEIIHAPKIGCINIHHGILPENRGLMCDLWAMSNGEPVGFSIHQITEKIDDGKLLSVEITANNPDKNYIKHLINSEPKEAKAMTDVLYKIIKIRLIGGTQNIANNPKYFKMPTNTQIKLMKQQGMIC